MFGTFYHQVWIYLRWMLSNVLLYLWTFLYFWSVLRTSFICTFLGQLLVASVSLLSRSICFVAHVTLSCYWANKLMTLTFWRKWRHPIRNRKLNRATTAAILKSDKRSYLRREWSDVSEMWHADAEWHDNYGDEVKIETEKSDGLKTKNCSLVVPVCKSGMLFHRAFRSWTTGWFTKQRYWHTVRSASRAILRLCCRNGWQRLLKTIS